MCNTCTVTEMIVECFSIYLGHLSVGSGGVF